MKRGQLIVFEGIDGVGKTTLSKAVVDAINSKVGCCRWYSFPGSAPGTIGHLVYQLHHGEQQFEYFRTTATSLQVLHVAAHIDLIEAEIIPALLRGQHIVLDRFWWSTWAYGLGSGADVRAMDALVELESICWRGISPTRLIYLSSANSNPSNSNEMNNVAKNYEQLIARESTKYPIEIIERTSLLADVQKVLTLLSQN